MCSGGLADRIGRKTVFAATLVIYSLATAACAFAPNLTWLLVFRFIVGLGLGGQLPVAVTLVSEYIPAQVRGRFIVLLESFWGLGWLLRCIGGVFCDSKFWLAYGLLNRWDSCTVRHCDLVQMVPESIPYFINRGRIVEAHALVKQIERQMRCGSG